MLDELHNGSGAEFPTGAGSGSAGSTGSPGSSGETTNVGGAGSAGATGGVAGAGSAAGAGGAGSAGGGFEPGGSTADDAGGPEPDFQTPPRGGTPESPSFADRVAAMRGPAGDEHYEPDALTLLGDVLQRPAAAFAYLGLHRAERVGLALIVYALSQLPFALAGDLVAVDTSFGGLTRQIVTAIVYLFVSTAILHLIARLMGGRNRYVKLLQSLGMASLPSLLTAPVLLLLPQWGGLAGGAASVWTFVLGVIAVREVYRFSTGRALAAVLMPVLLAVALFMVMLALGVSLGVSVLPDLLQFF